MADKPELDTYKIRQRSDEIIEAVASIQRILQECSEERLRHDKDTLASLKYYIIQSYEAMGSICLHINAKLFGVASRSYGHCFEIMEEHDIFDEEIKQRLKKLIAFRNELVHQYWNISDDVLLEFCRNNIDTFRAFVKSVNNYIRL